MSSARSVESNWCAGDDHADVASSFSISGLVSGDLEGRTEQTVTTQYRVSSTYFLPDRTEQNKQKPDMQLKKVLLAAQTTSRQMSSNGSEI